ncbi:MAG: cytochrome bc complex cytochrome b subunit [bacterium]
MIHDWKSYLLESLHLQHTAEAVKNKVVPHHRASIWYYFGGLALMFFVIQVVTGIMLLFYYEPTAQTAHQSIERIMTQVPFGWLIRSLHAWSANALMAVVFIHMFSAFLMKSYRTPRYIMWLTGIILFILMLGFGFTGYLLPWDQTAYFATKIGTQTPRALPLIGDIISSMMTGAKDVNGTTLLRMFALHVGVLPAISILLVVVHIGLIMLLGSGVAPGTVVTGQTKYFPDYLLKEIMVWLVGFGLLIGVAVLYPWELGKAYNLANPVEPAVGIHPEWYFMFLYQTLKVVPEWLAIIVFGLLFIFWTFVPFLDRKAHRGEKSPIFTYIGVAAIVYICVMTTWAYIAVSEEQSSSPLNQQHSVQKGNTDAK